ncbi:MAG: competence protein ComEA [Cyclobacteriaceae bacterium]
MFNNIKKYIRKYFGFSESETNGFLIFIPLVVLIFLVPSFFKSYLLSTSEEIDREEERIFREWVEESERKLQSKDTIEFNLKSFDFDPNLATIAELIDLGFKRKVAERIGNYRDKGGRFRKNEDLLKIYGINKPRVEELWDHIKIKVITKRETPSFRKKTFKNTTYSEKVLMDLNLAESDSLIKIRGIGEVLSERIIKYRNSLGGFVSTDQISEVYGLKPEVIENILERYYVEAPLLTKVNLNEDSIKILAKHPYISYSLAKVVIAYKGQHGAYKSIEDIRKIKIMTDSLFNKLSPYLKVDNPDLLE